MSKIESILNYHPLPILYANSSSPVGLPATSITLDEQRIYWTNSSFTTIYYVERTDVNTLLTLESSVTDAIIIATSPGTQQLPPILSMLLWQYENNMQ